MACSVYTIIILSTLASLRFLQSFLYLSSAITFWLLMLVFTITLSLLISYFTFFGHVQTRSYWWSRNQMTVAPKHDECAKAVATALRKKDTDQFLPPGTRKCKMIFKSTCYQIFHNKE